MSAKSLTVCLSIVVFGFLLFGAFAAQTTFAADQPWDARAFSVDPATLSQALSAVSEPGEKEVIIFLDETRVSFEADGRKDYNHRLIFKVLSEDGVGAMSSIKVDWEPWHESKPTIHARVIDPDLTVHELDPKTLTVVGAQSDQQDVYTDTKTVEGPLPAMVPGAIVEESFDIQEKQPLFAAGIAGRIPLDWDVPVEHSRVILDSPESFPLHALVRSPMPLLPEIVKDRGRRIWTLKTDRIAALRSIPPFLPPDVPRSPEVDFSTAASWQTVVDGYSQILDREIVTDQAKAFAANVAQGAKTRDQTIAALVAGLHKEIRYTGVEFGQSSLEPATPADVLRRKYGDCKDKAALLVAMLRSEGIPAYLALLSAGEDEDIDPQMPGMGLFDHAVVYVPSASASGTSAGDLWIDATDEYARVGHIPGDDQGRWALVIKPKQDALVRTPVSTSGDNRLIETREFTLAENGPAHVVETSDSWGSIEAGYRSYFDADTKNLQGEFESYMKTAYLADGLTKLDNTAIDDFSAPFWIRLQADRATRGISGPAEADVAVLLSGLTDRLPNYFTSESNGEDEKPTAPPRTDDFIVPEPYVEEWRYHIIPPPGFAANRLPDARDQQIGPARLTETFQENADGTVDARIRFDTGPRRITAEQAADLRAGIIALNKEKAVMVTFHQIGEAELTAGKVVEALTQFRSLVAMHPNEALHHDQIARAFLSGGMGELARAEAKKGIELEPKSAEAYSELAFVLDHDPIGRQFKKGLDYNGAIEAFEKAVQLDPNNDRIRASYAFLLQHNADGVLYGTGARLNDAIDQYRAVKDPTSAGLGDYLPDALMWAKRFPELKQEAEKAPASDRREMQLLVARTAMDGAPAAIAQAATDHPDSAEQRKLLLATGAVLMELRMYPQAADLLEAGAKGASQSAAGMLAEAAALRSVKPYEDPAFPDSDPRSVVRKLLIEDRGAATSVEDISSLFTESARRYFEDEDSIATWTRAPGTYRVRAARSKVPFDVVLDTDLASMQYGLEGSEATGYQIACSGPGTNGSADNFTFLVIRENGTYKVVGVKGSMNPVIGDQIMRFGEAGNLTAATQWLNWMRDSASSTDSDDPLASPTIARMWEKGQSQDKSAIENAAAGLMSGGKVFAPEAAPILLKGLASAASREERVNLDKALADAYESQREFANELPVARRLAKEAPDSETAAEMLERALGATKQWDESIHLAEDRLNKKPDDARRIRQYAWVLWQAGRLDESQAARKKLIDSGKATADDYNSIAWNYLIEDKVTADAVQEAERGTLLSDERNGAMVDTQAAIYAETGRASEAYAMELQAIDLDGDEEPNEASWYVFGRIAEQYGEREAAIEDYNRIKMPRDPWATSTSDYLLAQRRLKVLEQTAK